MRTAFKMRTRFSELAHGRVGISYFDEDLERRVTREFYVAGGQNRPGYVYESLGAGEAHQVCERLYHRGPTLTTTRDGLLDLIRREWRKRRTVEIRDRQS